MLVNVIAGIVIFPYVVTFVGLFTVSSFFPFVVLYAVSRHFLFFVVLYLFWSMFGR